MSKNNINESKEKIYKEVYEFGVNTLVVDLISNTTYIKKELDTYNISAFEYIHKHPHKNICSIIDYWENNNKLIVIEEYIQGKTLDVFIKEDKPDYNQIKNIYLQILDGVIHLHSANPRIIHRDIKSSNIMIDGEGNAKLIDFESAKPYQPGQERDTILIGTPGSAAPEQYGFSQSDERTDIYALGILARELFPNQAEIKPIIKKAIQMDPNNRFTSVVDMKHRIMRPFAFSVLSNIPGIRHDNFIIKIISLIIYLFLIYSSFTSFFSGATTPFKLWTNRICFLLYFLSVIDLWFDWTHLFRNKYIDNQHPIIQLIIKAIITYLMFYGWAIISQIITMLIQI